MAEAKQRFNPPPGWPLPTGFTPPPGWRPDLSWPTAPADWEYWVAADAPPPRRPRPSWLRWPVVGLIALLLLVTAFAGWAVFLGTAGLVALLVAGVAMTRGGLPTLWLRGRGAAAALGVLGVAALTIGGSFVDHSPDTTSAPQTPGGGTATSVPLSTTPAASPKTQAASPPATPPPTTPAREISSGRPAPGTALAAVPALLVKGRAPLTGYARTQFGPAWADVDRNGCDTRNDVLRRDLQPVAVRAGTHGCKVVSGVLADPYTGGRIAFTRGIATSARVQIDHVVALADAWQKGAQHWTASRREAFANDPLELLAVDGPTNLHKGAGDAATWLPPNKSYRCAYIARQVSIKRKYGLWITAAERDAFERILRGCPRQPLVTDAAARRPKAEQARVVAPTPAAPSSRASSTPGSARVYYPNCDAVRAAGAAPLHRNDPGYSRTLDRDGDGIACE